LGPKDSRLAGEEGLSLRAACILQSALLGLLVFDRWNAAGRIDLPLMRGMHRLCALTLNSTAHGHFSRALDSHLIPKLTTASVPSI
jgi:hypothetical protein